MKSKDGILRWRGKQTLLHIMVAILVFGVLICFINIYELRRLQTEHISLSHGMPVVEASGSSPFDHPPVYWVYGKKPDSGYLKHVYAVLSRLGYLHGTKTNEWDVLWAHDYPFLKLPELKKLLPHQRVNHFPGSGFVTNKVSLATSNISFIPRSFKIPLHAEKFRAFARDNPSILWVQKGSNHRGIKIKKVSELDFSRHDTFVQQYVDQPYLIDGRRFDIGIYTAITSINPLRIYINQGEWLVRFCPDEYYPFDSRNLNKYVISDDYKPMWEIPTLKKYYTDRQYTFKQSLLTHLRSEGRDTDLLQYQMMVAIREVYLKKENSFISIGKQFKSLRNFFEMVRFDFVLDKNMKLYLMEVNMSPNLSSGHFAPNKQLYEHTLFGFFSLVGIAKSTLADLSRSSSDAVDMQVSDRDIHTYQDTCTNGICAVKNQSVCQNENCFMCEHCITGEQKTLLKSAYLEHLNRKTWRRVFPKPFKTQLEGQNWVSSSDDQYKQLNSMNKWMTLWFHKQCARDEFWCS